MSVFLIVFEVIVLGAVVATANTWTFVQWGGLPVLIGAVIGGLLAWPSCKPEGLLNFATTWSCTAEHFPVHRLTSTVMQPEAAVFVGVMLEGMLIGAIVAFALLVVFAVIYGLIKERGS